MLLKLTLTATEVPVIFRNRIAEIIKSAAESGYESLNMGLTDKSFKFFTFNLAFSRDKFRKEAIVFDNSFEVHDTVFYIPENKFVTLYISSPYEKFLLAVQEGFERKKDIDFSRNGQILVGGKKLTYMLENSKLLNRPFAIEAPEVTLHTHSPVLLEAQNSKKPIIPPVEDGYCELEVSEKEYSDRLAEISSMRIFGMTGKYPLEPIVFRPVKLRKTVIKHTLDKFREKTGKSLMMLTGITGTFQLSGHPEDLSLLVESGIGIRTTQGFGMAGPSKL
ncbi:MAG: CRISPR-associated endoribonuclease Cas6 [Deferribacterales bacterium]